MSKGKTILIRYTGDERCRLNNGYPISEVGLIFLLWLIQDCSDEGQYPFPKRDKFEVISPWTIDTVLIKIFFRVRVYQDFFHKDA